MSTWIKLFNSMPSHPKFLAAGDRAGWLFVCGCCYSNEHLTDGFISAHVLPVAAPGVRNADALAARLVTAGLWHEVNGGWRIHDYGDHQRSSSEVRERRASDAARQAKRRVVSTRSPHGHFADSTADSTAESDKSPSGVTTAREKSREEGRKERKTTNLRSVAAACFSYWQQSCGHPTSKLTSDRRSKIESRLREGYTGEQIRQAIDGAARAAFVNDAGKRFDDIELICRSGSKLESFIERATGSNVVRIGKSSSHLPESQRPTAEWLAQVDEHLARQEPA